MSINNYEFWLVVGTQHLYGSEIFSEIDSHSNEIAQELSQKLPCKVVAKPCVKTSSEILTVMQQANNSANCAGVITWMHRKGNWCKGYGKPYTIANGYKDSK